jgi:Glyoxalase-like domain
MAFEMDHVFILAEAPRLDALVALGLTEGSRNRHPGQGTANRRIFLRNAMLELLWVENEAEVRSEAIARTHLWERWNNRDRGCPFGIALRPAGDSPSSAPLSSDPLSSSENPAIAFPYWEFRPPYLPPHLSIAMGDNSDNLAEPLLFQTPFGKRPDQQPPERAQPLTHPLGLGELTRVTLISPDPSAPSPAWQAVLDTQQVEIVRGDRYGLELGFDGEGQGQQVDFYPQLPLRFAW